MLEVSSQREALTLPHIWPTREIEKVTGVMSVVQWLACFFLDLARLEDESPIRIGIACLSARTQGSLHMQRTLAIGFGLADCN